MAETKMLLDVSVRCRMSDTRGGRFGEAKNSKEEGSIRSAVILPSRSSLSLSLSPSLVRRQQNGEVR
jgi:hypothetical protein